MWKILTIIAAVALVGTGIVGYQNKLGFEREVDLRKAAVKKRDDTTALLASTKEELKKTEDELATVQQTVVKLKAELSEIELAISEQEKKETELSAELDDIITEVATAKTLMENIGTIDEFEKQLEQSTAELASVEQSILSAQNAVAIAESQRQNVQARIDEYLALERDQRSGVIRKRLRASVESAYNEWGFVVINAGDKQGVVPKAELAVARQGMQICRLTVTNVEPGSSVASIVPGSLAPGQFVLPGDLVFVIPKSAPAMAAES